MLQPKRCGKTRTMKQTGRPQIAQKRQVRAGDISVKQLNGFNTVGQIRHAAYMLFKSVKALCIGNAEMQFNHMPFWKT